jgi:glycosyltransferase involved in cell wall biosynthesis
MTVPTIRQLPRNLASPGERFGSLRFGLLGTYPPTVCGLATFAAALRVGLSANGADVDVVSVSNGSAAFPDEVIGEQVNDSAASVAACSDLLNQNDIAIIQHEYGIYGGVDGDEVVEIIGSLRVPSVVVAHTVLKSPTPHQRAVLESIAALADQVVVMSEAAKERLQVGYHVDPRKITTIPHGATIPRSASPRRSGRPTLLTWGLLGPGKGVERVIDAMAHLRDLPGPPLYLIAGQTHPKVLANVGDEYRSARIEQARKGGVADLVRFDAGYRTIASLNELAQSAAAVVLPYDSTDQVTSGVLVDAIASGRPVVATAFPHAVELLGTGAGIVVDHDDPDALHVALRRVLSEPELAASMADEARRLAPTMAWSVVARQYLRLAQQLAGARAALT